MAYGKSGNRGAKRRGSSSTRKAKSSKMAPYYNRQRTKTFGKYSAATLYKYPQSSGGSVRYFSCVKYLTSHAPSNVAFNTHAGQDAQGQAIVNIKSAVRAGDLVDCALFEKMRYQFGGFTLSHVGASWTVSETKAGEKDFAPIGYSSMLCQDFNDRTGLTGNQGTIEWLQHHDGRLPTDFGTTKANFSDQTSIDANINTKIHTMKAGTTTISRFYKTGKREDQRGSFSLTAAGTTADWSDSTNPNSQREKLRKELDEKMKMSLIFFLPRANVQCAIVTTFKCVMHGQPNFN
jgi:hypothetical protein